MWGSVKRKPQPWFVCILFWQAFLPWARSVQTRYLRRSCYACILYSFEHICMTSILFKSLWNLCISLNSHLSLLRPTCSKSSFLLLDYSQAFLTSELKRKKRNCDWVGIHFPFYKPCALTRVRRFSIYSSAKKVS